MHFLTHRNSSAFGFTVTPDAHKMLQSRILALAQLAKSLAERFYPRNTIRPNCYYAAVHFFTRLVKPKSAVFATFFPVRKSRANQLPFQARHG